MKRLSFSDRNIIKLRKSDPALIKARETVAKYYIDNGYTISETPDVKCPKHGEFVVDAMLGYFVCQSCAKEVLARRCEDVQKRIAIELKLREMAKRDEAKPASKRKRSSAFGDDD